MRNLVQSLLVRHLQRRKRNSYKLDAEGQPQLLPQPSRHDSSVASSSTLPAPSYYYSPPSIEPPSLPNQQLPPDIYVDGSHPPRRRASNGKTPSLSIDDSTSPSTTSYQSTYQPITFAPPLIEEASEQPDYSDHALAWLADLHHQQQHPLDPSHFPSSSKAAEPSALLRRRQCPTHLALDFTNVSKGCMPAIGETSNQPQQPVTDWLTDVQNSSAPVVA